MAKASLIASLRQPPSADGRELLGLPDCVDWIEVRADLCGDIPVEWLRSHFKGRLQFSLRSVAAGGQSSDGSGDRIRRLMDAASCYDRVELESGDLDTTLLSAILPERRCLASYEPAGSLADLQASFRKLSSVPASIYKLNPRAISVADEFLPLYLLKSLGRSDTIAYADGPLGFWNRLAALHLGAPAIYGAVESDSVTPAEPSVAKLIDDYGVPEIGPVKELFAIIGDPVFHSLSPRLHNASYRAANYPALF